MHKLTPEEFLREIELSCFIDTLIQRMGVMIINSKRKEAKMKATYETTIKIKVIHEIDSIEDLKDNNEFAHCIGAMVCDEATSCGAVATYDVLESKLDVR